MSKSLSSKTSAILSYSICCASVDGGDIVVPAVSNADSAEEEAEGEGGNVALNEEDECADHFRVAVAENGTPECTRR